MHLDGMAGRFTTTYSLLVFLRWWAASRFWMNMGDKPVASF